jgi:hypothetical protein
MAPFRTRNLGSGIVVGLLTVLMVGLPRVAWADLGDEPSKPEASQSDDKDRPKDSILDKKPADEAVAAKKAQEAPKKPFYEKWQFWALTGGIIVGGIAAILTAQKIAHQMAGGDARPCNTMAFITCTGDGH